MFKVLPIKDRELFLRYAIPCGEFLVKRGELKGEVLDSLNEAVRNGSGTAIPIEKVFNVAARMCTIIAKQMGKHEIDAEVIRRYFLVEHENAIKWRQQVRPELKLEDCLVHPGRVLKINEGNILVRTPLGDRLFRNDFAHGLAAKDWVSVHYDYISEKINPVYAGRMKGSKR
jgi:hypothetical protein